MYTAAYHRSRLSLLVFLPVAEIRSPNRHRTRDNPRLPDMSFRVRAAICTAPVFNQQRGIDLPMGGVQQKFQHKLLVQDAVSGKMAQRALCILIRFLQGYKPCQFHHKISFPFLNWGNGIGLLLGFCSPLLL